MTTSPPNAKLLDWDQLATHEWKTLVIGNGVSRAVWDDFKYPSLYDVAVHAVAGSALTPDDQALFAALGDTRHFEGVLGALFTASVVNDALSLPIGVIKKRYQSIRKALIAAVHRVHIPWSMMPTATLLTMRAELVKYGYVFTTNYDLLIYWAMMADSSDDFRDYFWSLEFDISDTEVWKAKTRVLYLHGALHLYYSLDGRTSKEVAGPGANLLDLFGKRPDSVPLCITEGTAAQKMSAIARSDYLSFSLEKLSRRRGALVLLGQGLGESDAHVAAAIDRGGERDIAVGIYPSSTKHIVREKAHYRKVLPEATLHFFDSRSHPLTAPTMRVTP